MFSFRKAAAALLLAAVALPAAAEPVAYPHKVVSLVTHSSPGGGSDVFLRELSKILRKYVAATFVVENVQGGSGARAMARVAAAKPDGATL
ncbi:MAG: tripartite tricarboxylate transporter substrate binding protein, partial [Gemmatimonadaceae bacterium]|nr:tripartite tricarboxylate transporter substrate binding protein [Acetobacteraceae bacterium]